MSFFPQALTLVTAPPGSFVYHFITLLALQAALFISAGQWWQSRDSAPGRLAIAAGLAIVGRLALLILSLLAYYGLVASAAVLPPLDRAISTATILIVGWALIFPRGVRLAAVVVVGLLIFTGLGYAVSAILWFPAGDAGQVYNGVLQETLWEVVQIAFLLIGLAALLIRRQGDWGVALGLLLTLLIGHFIHFIAPLEGQSLPGAERLAELAAMPLLAVAAYRRAVSQAAAAPPVSPGVAMPASASATRSPVAVEPPSEKPCAALTAKAAESLAALSTSLDSAGVCQRITAGVGRLMLADLTLFITPPGDAGLATIACAFDLIRELHLGGFRLATLEMPTLHKALTTGRPARLAPSAHAVELNLLDNLLGVKAAGPAMIVPIAAEGHNLGALIVLSPYSDREWNAADQEMLAGLVPAIAATILNAQKFIAFDERLTALTAELHNAQSEATDNQRQAERFALALDEVRQQLERESDRAKNLAAQLQAQSETGAALEAAITERARLEGDLRAAQSQLDDLSSQLEAKVEDSQRQRLGLAEAKALASDLQAQLATVAAAPPPAPEPSLDDQPASGEVVAAIAQELRQPMSSISGYTDLLLGESVGIIGALQRKFLERVKASTERMGSLLDDLIRVTAIDTGTLKLEPEAVDVVGAIDDAITRLGGQFREKGITLRMDIADDLPTLKADRDAIYQIVSHLLSNASSASTIDGEVLLSATSQTTDDARFLFLSVKDSGGGISPEDRGRVFTRLYRADNPLIAGLGDTGVGLSIVKALVEAHGGRVWVDSEAGVGSTFSVLLPVNGAGARAT